MNISLNNFLTTNFKKDKLKKPLFYNFEYGLRINLQSNYEFESDSYFKECIDRSLLIFENTFEPNDNILVVINISQNKRKKISKNNFIFSQIKNLNYRSVYFKKYSNHHNSELKLCIQANIQSSTKHINYFKLIEALIHRDFPNKIPRITDDLIFVNLDKKIIFKIYDDRGLDVVSKTIETLEPIYKKYNEWILDYDRVKIDHVFNIKK
ncbi:DUF3885 domain-containing protein [Leptospira terpstrae]|uniref:PF13021 domain protein n=1 Tax=Leptospira terpstrae serovar Hualin str. LT 11-33 = ATCC 700639 TaxID=1257025 RepID=N1VJJ5_9LEPT|nr:DUF3885 domain-containing protein [Leptospira terpstrae]EMY59899.1 PF13021 domain protein [Leptospira terpstrae serovar Hualin str. LT 11-33 = ATCC 700639]